MKFRLKNINNNEWLNKANMLIEKYENNNIDNATSLHHILIRSLYPEYTNNKDNHIYMTKEDHWLIHYYMWKADAKYCAAFWFCYVYFKKHFNMTITSDEELQLKYDMKIYRQNKRKNTYEQN